LINPDSGEIAFWTEDTGIDGHNPVDLDATGFAGMDPHQMTMDQMRELAARYNGGPDWDKPIAQGYADNFESSRRDVNIVLYGD
jgi:hypothetical protein